MKIMHRIVAGYICLGIVISSLADIQQPAAGQNTGMSQTPTVLGSGPGSDQESMVEENNDLENEYESNGPEGSHGVPMKRMSFRQILLVVAILLAGAGLAATARKSERRDEPT